MLQNIRTFGVMVRQLIAILNRKQKIRGCVLLFLLIGVSLLETLGISVIIPFIIAMLEPDVLIKNKYVAVLIEFFKIDSYNGVMLLTAAGIIIVYVLKNSLILAANYYQTNYRNTLEKQLSVKMLSSYMKRPYGFFLDTNSAQVLRGITGDIACIATIIDGISGLAAEGLTCIFIGLFLVYLSPFIATMLLLLAGGTALFIVLCFKKRISICGIRSREAFAERYQYAYQAVNGIKEISVMQRRKSFVKQYERASEKARKFNTSYLFISKMPNRLVETAFITGLLLLVCFSIQTGDSVSGYVSELGTLAFAATRILPAISNIANYMNSLVYNRPALGEVYINMREAEKIDEEGQEKWQNMLMSKKAIGFEKELSVNNVSWRYKEGLPCVLDHLSMTIHKGEAIALIGESGAGKTTLADIILGLFHPKEGMILSDNVDIFDDLPGWSKIIGYVPQTVFLIDDTVRNNIAFGIPEEQIDDDLIWRALEQAQLKNVVEKMPQGLDTILGERGVKISGGQRQRIAIARALYYNPQILVLDEATSALDTETENAVMESIDALQGHKTLIIVAHRLTTIEKCDKIYEITHGQAIERSHEEIFGKE